KAATKALRHGRAFPRRKNSRWTCSARKTTQWPWARGRQFRKLRIPRCAKNGSLYPLPASTDFPRLVRRSFEAVCSRRRLSLLPIRISPSNSSPKLSGKEQIRRLFLLQLQPRIPKSRNSPPQNPQPIWRRNTCSLTNPNSSDCLPVIFVQKPPFQLRPAAESRTALGNT